MSRMKVIFDLTKRIATLFGSKKSDLSQSKLVGMYLNQTNSKDGYSSEREQSRQRRNGKYSHTRERA